MRTGFKWLIVILVITVLVAMFGPAFLMALKGGHP